MHAAAMFGDAETLHAILATGLSPNARLCAHEHPNSTERGTSVPGAVLYHPEERTLSVGATVLQLEGLLQQTQGFPALCVASQSGARHVVRPSSPPLLIDMVIATPSFVHGGGTEFFILHHFVRTMLYSTTGDRAARARRRS